MKLTDEHLTDLIAEKKRKTNPLQKLINKLKIKKQEKRYKKIIKKGLFHTDYLIEK